MDDPSLMTPPFVAFQNVNKRYGDGPVILADLDLEVRKGEFVSLIGPSGCGKSSILRLIAGLSPVTEGTLLIEGEVPEGARDDLFFVFQDPHLLPWLRVHGNVGLPLKLRGESKRERMARVDELLDLVGLAHARDLFPWQLSGGMRMRTAVARALSLSPRVLLLDEPFGTLDEMTRDRLNEELLALREQNPFTAFFVTHSIAEAVFLSSRIVVLTGRPGRIAASIDVPFPYPRRAELRESGAYLELLAEVSHALREVKTEE